LSKDKYNQTAWQKAAEFRKVILLKKMWNFFKELQLKPDRVRNEVLLSKDKYNQTACTRQQNFAM
jgi:hypothetical protein